MDDKVELVSSSYYSYYDQNLVVATLSVVGIFLLFFGIYLARPIKSKVAEVKQLVSLGMNKPRFRKRDKVMFYGRKMLRKVKSVKDKVKMISGQVKGPPGRKRKLVMKLARRLLQRRENQPHQLKVIEPPVEYLQEDISEALDQRLPAEVIYMLQNIRMFGNFEKPIFLELIKHIETIHLRPHQHLFMIGDPDTNIYIVQNGQLRVYITDADGSTVTLKGVKKGESICSLLSFTEFLTGQSCVFKTVAACAEEESLVLRLPASAFQEVFEKHPDALVRAIQIIMVRLQRVTFLALHQYLGLSSELVKTYPHKSSGSSSPIKLRMREHLAKVGGIQNEVVLDSANPPTPPSSESGKRRMKDEKDYQYLVQSGIDGFVKLLGLEDSALLDGQIEVRELISGTYIMKEDTHQKDAALIYVVSGTLSVSQKATNKSDDVQQMFLAHAGELVGGLAALTGEPSFFTVRSRHTACVAMLSKSTFYSIMAKHPKVVLNIARTVIYRLSPFVRQIDFALDWVYIESGRALYRQGDESDCTYIVLSGRLRSVITHHNGKKELVGEYGRGDMVGIVETLTQNSRSTTVMAVRDTELAKMPEGLLNAIKLKFPMVVSRLINLLGHRILGSWQTPSLGQALHQQRSPQSNFSTVAVLPVSDDVPLSQFSHELFLSLGWIGPTILLTSDYIRRTLGSSIMESTNEYRLSAWLGQQEDQHRIVLYQCDQSPTAWTHRCIRQADCILIVALADREPSVGVIEKKLETIAIRTQKELILLHKESAVKPKNTVDWLNARSWCSSHHHIKCPARIFSKKYAFKPTDPAIKQQQQLRDIHSDFARLARLLTGESVGLVLGGGGARGAAHVGMIQAITEAGIPIDMVGGVSIGAFMGALWCMEKDIREVSRKARAWSFKMTQLWRQLYDLTYPVTSMFSGAGFNHMIRETFGEDSQMEDLWLPYFTITTDITSSSMRLHTHGSLWRSIRASMSIAGWLPPMCDPTDGHLLVDGCYVNNVPADVMRSRGAKHILAIDVGSQDDTDLTNYGDCLSGWWLLWKKWNPFASPVKVPNLPDIQSRLAYVSCVRQLEEVKKSDYCEYIRPPIDKYKTLQFGSYDEIRDVGYNHGKTYFTGLQKAGLINNLTKPTGHKKEFKNVSPTSYGLPNYYPYSQRYEDHTRRAHPQRRPQTFTDLAEMVAKVRCPNRMNSDEFSESESEEDYSEENDELSEAYDDHNVNDQILRQRRKNSSIISDGDFIPSS